MSLNIMITGTNSGFGKLIVNSLLAKGHTVIATMRQPEGRNQAAAGELAKAGATVVEMDVTDEGSIARGLEQALQSHPRIDVLINNAGLGVIGWQEGFTIENFQRLFDVNVFGVQRMTRALLPLMKKQGGGTLIQISSLLGQFVLPFMGPYNATKHAVEALAENYRVELSQFGIESLIVQPGAFGTTFNANLMRAGDQDRVQSYGEAAGAPDRQLAGFEQNLAGENAPNPQMVADAIAQLLDKPRGERPFRTVVDGLGMGPQIENINAATESAMRGVYGHIGMDGLLQLR